MRENMAWKHIRPYLSPFREMCSNVWLEHPRPTWQHAGGYSPVLCSQTLLKPTDLEFRYTVCIQFHTLMSVSCFPSDGRSQSLWLWMSMTHCWACAPTSDDFSPTATVLLFKKDANNIFSNQLGTSGLPDARNMPDELYGGCMVLKKTTWSEQPWSNIK